MGKVLAVNLDSSLRNNTSLNEFMSKGKSEQLKPQYEKTEDKGYGCNAWGSEIEQPEKPKPSHQDKLKSEFGKYSEQLILINCSNIAKITN